MRFFVSEFFYLRYPEPMAPQLLRDTRFGAFFWTQFLGAFNDNLLKFAITFAVTYNESLRGDWPVGLLVNAIAGVFILPFVLFSATSGQLADKYDKTKVMRLAKWLEPPIVLLAACGFFLESAQWLLFAVFLLGTQASFFGPAKYAFLPEQLKAHELVLANALVESATFVAILLGSILASSVVTSDAGPMLVYAVCLGALLVALLGVLCVQRIPLTPSQAPHLQINWNVLSATWRNVQFAMQLKRVWPSVLGISWLWFVGATYLTQFPLLSKTVLNASSGVATLLLLVFTVGLACGALVCERVSRQRIEMGMVPWGLFIMALGGALLHGVLTQYTPAAAEQTVFHFFSQIQNMALLCAFALISFGVGVYSVPLYASMQALAPRSSRSRVVAANNIVNALFMVGSAGFAVLVLVWTHGQVAWVLFALSALNLIVLIVWCVQQPYVVLRALLLFKVPRKYLPLLADLDHLGHLGGYLIVVPTLLHENHLQRMAGLPFETTIVLSGRLQSGWFVQWMRKHQFVQEYTHLSSIDAKKELIRHIASHMQQGKAMVIDQPMYAVLREQYRLDDMPHVLRQKGTAMNVLEFQEAVLHTTKNQPTVWHLVRKEIAPA